ncbi:MAG: hypothetical protein ACE5E9_04470 [Nitrospinaceae bacterium]
MRKKTLFLVAICYIQAAVVAGPSNGQSLKNSSPRNGEKSFSIPKEPGWNDPSYRGWEVMSINGLISTYYDLDLDGELDYMVIRKIQRKAAREEVSIEQAIAIAKHDGLSVYFSHPVIYFTNRHPLFYCLGVDFRRNCRDIWVDISEDGLNGNEQLYTLSTPSLGVR